MKNSRVFNFFAHTTLILMIGLTLAQVALLLIISGKTAAQLSTSPLLPTLPFHWENFARAWDLGIKDYMGNSLVLSISIVVGNTALAVITAYVFARYKFPGKTFFFSAILALMMIPGILTLVPRYLLICDLYLLDAFWAVILPSMFGANAFQKSLCGRSSPRCPKNCSRQDASTARGIRRCWRASRFRSPYRSSVRWRFCSSTARGMT